MAEIVFVLEIISTAIAAFAAPLGRSQHGQLQAVLNPI
jgi:hypothetical protein